MASTSKTENADAQFKKIQRAQDGKKAMAEYEAAGIAMRAKTEKLKALRLARDAELAAAVAANPTAKPARKLKPKQKAPTISDYHKDQQGSLKR